MKYLKVYEAMIPKFLMKGIGKVYKKGLEVITSGYDGKTLDSLSEKELKDLPTIYGIIDLLSKDYDGTSFQSKYPQFGELREDFKRRFPIEEVNRRLMSLGSSID